MDRIRWITHRDQKILFVDCTRCTVEEIAALADQLPSIVTKEPPGSVLLLADFTGAQFDKQSVEHIKVAAVFDRSHLKRAAWVLSDNLSKTLLDSIRSFSQRNIPSFSNKEEALAYLIE